MSSVEANKKEYEKLQAFVSESSQDWRNKSRTSLVASLLAVEAKLEDMKQYLFPPNAKSYYTGEKE